MDRVRLLATALFAAGLLTAAVVDWRVRRVPNPLVAALLAGGLAMAAWIDGGAGLVRALAGAALGSLALALPYRLGLVGAGDVKLLGAAGAWLGPGGVLLGLLAAGVATALLAGVSYLRCPPETRRAIRGNLLGFALGGGLPDAGELRARPRSESVPFGVAVAAGGFYAWLMR